MGISVEKKYGSLRIITTVLWVVGLLFLIGGILSGISVLSAKGAGGTSNGLLMILGGIAAAILHWAAAQIIHLFIDMEENTRKTHILLERERD